MHNKSNMLVKKYFTHLFLLFVGAKGRRMWTFRSYPYSRNSDSNSFHEPKVSDSNPLHELKVSIDKLTFSFTFSNFPTSSNWLKMPRDCLNYCGLLAKLYIYRYLLATKGEKLVIIFFFFLIFLRKTTSEANQRKQSQKSIHTHIQSHCN